MNKLYMLAMVLGLCAIAPIVLAQKPAWAGTPGGPNGAPPGKVKASNAQAVPELETGSGAAALALLLGGAAVVLARRRRAR